MAVALLLGGVRDARGMELICGWLGAEGNSYESGCKFRTNAFDRGLLCDRSRFARFGPKA